MGRYNRQEVGITLPDIRVLDSRVEESKDRKLLPSTLLMSLEMIFVWTPLCFCKLGLSKILFQIYQWKAFPSQLSCQQTPHEGGRLIFILLSFVVIFKVTWARKRVDSCSLLQLVSHNLGFAVSISTTYTGWMLSVQDRGRTTTNVFWSAESLLNLKVLSTFSSVALLLTSCIEWQVVQMRSYNDELCPHTSEEISLLDNWDRTHAAGRGTKSMIPTRGSRIRCLYHRPRTIY